MDGSYTPDIRIIYFRYSGDSFDQEIVLIN